MIKITDFDPTDFLYSEQRLKKTIASGGKEFYEAFSKLSERRYHVGEAEVARKNLFHWEKEGLLPYEFHEQGWRKFSLIEFTWLKVIIELRHFGVSLQDIREIKSQLFVIDIAEFKTLLATHLQSLASQFEGLEDTLNLYNRKDIPESKWRELFDTMQVSSFSILVLQILVYRQNLCLVINTKKQARFVTLGNTVGLDKKVNEAYLNELMNESFSLINIRTIIEEFFDNSKIDHDNAFLLAFLNKNERVIIEKIREGRVKEIKIRFSGDEPVEIRFTKSVNPEEAINKVSRILKKGDFQDIRIKSVDGKLTYYEQTDIIKVK